RLDGERRLDVDGLQLIEIAWIPGPRRRNTEFSRQTVGIPLVPRPLNTVPARRRHPEEFGQRRPVPRQGGDDFIACRIQHPAFESEPASGVEHRFDRPRFIPQVRNAHRMRGEVGKAGNRIFIIDDAHRSAPASDAAYDPQSLKIAAEDDGPDLCGSHWRIPESSYRINCSWGPSRLCAETPTCK